ncbi:MAG: hypothetical protein ACRDTF_12575 [Pseudonocardiaceae bacterium]
MTAGDHSGPDQLTLNHHGADTGLAQLSVIRDLYAEVYAEPPYREGPADVADFAGGWPRRVGHPGFRLVIAWWGVEPIGFGFGHQLSMQTGWWGTDQSAESSHSPTGRCTTS